MKVLLLGAGGMLGRAFSGRLQEYELVTLRRSDLAIEGGTRIRGLLEAHRPDLVINCAAHTDVEGAEGAPDAAFSVNSVMPGLVAQACRSVGALMVHFSSTGCYGTAKADPYTEEDPLQPSTVHHRSKASGEIRVREAGCEHLILRTGWLFGGEPGAPKNFVWNRLLEARSKDRLVSDPWQFGNPTFVGDVVAQTLLLVRAQLRGTYNCVAQGRASRFEYVQAIVAAANLPCAVESAAQPFSRRAPVSPNEAALNWRLDLLGLDSMPLWQQTLSDYVHLLLRSPRWLSS